MTYTPPHGGVYAVQKDRHTSGNENPSIPRKSNRYFVSLFITKPESSPNKILDISAISNDGFLKLGINGVGIANEGNPGTAKLKTGNGGIGGIPGRGGITGISGIVGI